MVKKAASGKAPAQKKKVSKMLNKTSGRKGCGPTYPTIYGINGFTDPNKKDKIKQTKKKSPVVAHHQSKVAATSVNGGKTKKK